MSFSDRYGFQASNIAATVQLLRMLLFASDGGSIEERCKVASEVVDAFSNIPAAYLQATSSPLLHHLAGIGMILGTVFEEPLNETSYQQVRAVLLALADVLKNLDYSVQSSTSAQRLRNLVAQIDEYMSAQSEQLQPLAGIETQSSTSPAQHETCHDERAGSLQTIPAQLTNGLFVDWPWNFDIMPQAEGWSTDDLPVHQHNT
jgi:hypothetical protein